MALPLHAVCVYLALFPTSPLGNTRLQGVTFAAMSNHTQVGILEGLIQVTDWDYQTSYKWLRKLITHYQRPPFAKHPKTGKMTASLADYMIVCSSLPISQGVLRAKLNEIMDKHGYSHSDLDSLPFEPFNGGVNPKAALDFNDEEAGEACAEALCTATWNLRRNTFQGQHYFCAVDVATALGYRKPSVAISQHVAPQDRIPLKSIVTINKQSSCLNKNDGQLIYITTESVKKLVRKSNMPEAMTLSERLGVEY